MNMPFLDGTGAARPPAPQVFQTALPVRSHVAVNGEYRLIALAAPPDLLAACRPGQFFHLLCPAQGADRPFLRRPMSIYDARPETGELRFLYRIAGAGTRGLASLVPGQRLDLLGPLGQGFRLAPEWRSLLLLARGVGLATLAPLAVAARRQGARLTAICSARRPDLLMSIEHFESLGARVIPVTDSEGSADPLAVERLIDSIALTEGIDAAFTCGSDRLLRLLQRLAARHGFAGQVALEQQMACGLGMCHCCVRPIRREGRLRQLRVCREGPVFELEEVPEW